MTYNGLRSAWAGAFRDQEQDDACQIAFRFICCSKSTGGERCRQATTPMQNETGAAKNRISENGADLNQFYTDGRPVSGPALNIIDAERIFSRFLGAPQQKHKTAPGCTQRALMLPSGEKTAHPPLNLGKVKST